MPVEVEAPDGSVVEFPDGTSPQTMRDAMRRRYGGSPGYNRARRQQQRRVEAPRIPVVSDFNQFVDQIPRNLGVADELAAVGSGALQGVTNLARRATGQPVQTTMQEAGQAASDFQIAERERYRRANPGADIAATVAGIPLAVGSPAAGGVGFLSRAASGEGLGAWLAQTAQGGAYGAGFGGLFGALNADGGPEERLQGAQRGAEFGAVAGAAAPTVVNALRPVAGLFGRLRVDPSRLGTAGGTVTLDPPPPPSSIPRPAAGTIDRLAMRSRLSPDQVEQRLASARASPQGQTLSDIFDDAGVRTMRALAQAPGQTGQRAAEVARERFQAAPDRILGEFSRRLGVAETPEQALASLSKMYDEASSTLYQPLWKTPISPQARTTLEERLAPYADDPVFQDARRRAELIFARDVRNGRAQGGIEDNFARWAHYMKLGLDDAAKFAGTPQGGAMSTELSGIRDMRAQIIRALDDAIPGYAAARAQWGSLIEAEEALAAGGQLLNQNAGAVQQAMAGMTPFARYHARVGFANEIANRIGLRGSVNGNRNVAETIGSPEMQRRVAAMFDSPQEAAAFLDMLNQQNMLMRNAGQWGAGSQTYSNAMHGADEAMNVGADIAGSVATGNLGNAAKRGVGGLYDSLRGGAVEAANNARGEALLRRSDDDSARDFAKEVVQELRRREALRQANNAASRGGGAGAGAEASRRRQ